MKGLLVTFTEKGPINEPIRNSCEKANLEKKEGKEPTPFKEILKDVENSKKVESIEKGAKSLESKIKTIENILKELVLENPELDFSKLTDLLKELKNIIEVLNKIGVGISEKKASTFSNFLKSASELLSNLQTLLEKKDFEKVKELITSKLDNLLSEIKSELLASSLSKIENVSGEKKESLKPDGLHNTVIAGHKNSTTRENVVVEHKPLTEKQLKKEHSVNQESAKKFLETIKENISPVENKKIDVFTQGTVVKKYDNLSTHYSRVDLQKLFYDIAGRSLIVIKNGKSELRMNLFPPDLGKMNMKFVLEDGQLSGKIVVSTKEAFLLFDQNKESLANALSQAGVELGKIDISLGEFESENGQHNENMEERSFYFGNTTNSELESVDRDYEWKLLHSLYESSINLIV